MMAFGLDVRVTAKKLLREIKEDDVPGLAAELSYRFFLALFPFLLFVAALGGFVAGLVGIENPAERFIQEFGNSLPPDAASVIRTQVDEVVNGTNAGLISVSIAGALWAATGGVGALMKAVNRAYDIPESRPFWKKTAIAVGVTIGGGALMLGIIASFAATEVWTDDIAAWVGLASEWKFVVTILRVPLVVLFVSLAIAGVYWAAPNTGLPWKWITPGAVLFAVGWTVATTAFGIYVANFSSYGATYGTLGGVVVLMLWFYLSSLVLLAGAELNSVIDEERCGPALAERRRLVAQELAEKGIQLPGPERGTVPDGLDGLVAQAATAHAENDGAEIGRIGDALDEGEEDGYIPRQHGAWGQVDGYVKHHPVQSAVAALTAGFVIGRMKR